MSRPDRTANNQAALLKAREVAVIQTLPANQLKEVTDFEEQVLVLMDVLKLRHIKPPMIFGLKFETVNNKIPGRPMVIVVTDMATECPIFGGLPNRFWMEVVGLFAHPDKKEWRDAECEIFSRYLHLQPAFVEAKKRVHKLREEAAQKEAQATQAGILEKLKVAQPAHKIDSPLDDVILTHNKNHVFSDGKGVVFRLYHVPQKNEMRIKVIGCPKGHELEEASQGQVYIKQRDLVNFSGEDDTVVEGFAAISRQIRQYIRSALRAMGKYAPLPETADVKAATSESGNATPNADEHPSKEGLVDNPAVVQSSSSTDTAVQPSVEVKKVLGDVAVLPSDKPAGKRAPKKPAPKAAGSSTARRNHAEERVAPAA